MLRFPCSQEILDINYQWFVGQDKRVVVVRCTGYGLVRGDEGFEDCFGRPYIICEMGRYRKTYAASKSAR